jgi:hypothetical protein
LTHYPSLALQKCYLLLTRNADFHIYNAKIPRNEEFQMDKWTFGVTMLVVGMGGTLLTLGIMSMIIALLKKIFPYKKEDEEKA